MTNLCTVQIGVNRVNVSEGSFAQYRFNTRIAVFRVNAGILVKSLREFSTGLFNGCTNRLMFDTVGSSRGLFCSLANVLHSFPKEVLSPAFACEMSAFTTFSVIGSWLVVLEVLLLWSGTVCVVLLAAVTSALAEFDLASCGGCCSGYAGSRWLNWSASE